MIIPIRCFTCGKVVADKWKPFLKMVEEAENKKTKDEHYKKKILDKLKLQRYCCRRMILANVDMCDKI